MKWPFKILIVPGVLGLVTIALTTKVAVDPIAPEIRHLKSLLTNLALYSGDHDGVYPSCLGDLEVGIGDSPLYWHDGSPIHYITGLTDSAHRETPIVASPRPIKGERFVGFLGDYASILPKEEWQERLKNMLKDPKLSLRTTLEEPERP